MTSWFNRLAMLYGMSTAELLDCLGLGGKSILDLEWRLGAGEGALLGRRTGLTMAALQAMSFGDLVPQARMMIALGERRVCPRCPSDVRLKVNALPWSFWCPVHDARLQPAAAGCLSLQVLLPEEQLAALDRDARLGAMQLTDWARGATSCAALPDLLGLLTVRHRRSSPPSLVEQPRLSLAARRDNHGFLNTRIARQALLIVVPEYDNAAPLLTKPVRTGLFALAQGSLLQTYALSAGVGRLVAYPVQHAVAVLLASDVEGEQRVRQALRAWMPQLRREIYRRLRRLQSHNPDSARLTIMRRESHNSAQRRSPSH